MFFFFFFNLLKQNVFVPFFVFVLMHLVVIVATEERDVHIFYFVRGHLLGVGGRKCARSNEKKIT